MNAQSSSRIFCEIRTGCRILLAAFLLVSVATLAGAMEPGLIVFENQRGAVSFDHAAHVQQLPECAACHHAGQAPGSCRECHIGAPGIPRSRDALHKSCKGCHLASAGPVRCDDCHGERPLDQ